MAEKAPKHISNIPPEKYPEIDEPEIHDPMAEEPPLSAEELRGIEEEFGPEKEPETSAETSSEKKSEEPPDFHSGAQGKTPGKKPNEGCSCNCHEGGAGCLDFHCRCGARGGRKCQG